MQVLSISMYDYLRNTCLHYIYELELVSYRPRLWLSHDEYHPTNYRSNAYEFILEPSRELELVLDRSLEPSRPESNANLLSTPPIFHAAGRGCNPNSSSALVASSLCSQSDELCSPPAGQNSAWTDQHWGRLQQNSRISGQKWPWSPLHLVWSQGGGILK